MDISSEDISSSIYEKAEISWDNRFEGMKRMNGIENPYSLHSELGELLLENVLIVRENSKLSFTLEKLEEIESRFKEVRCLDTTHWSNPTPSFINQLRCMIQLSKVITKGALLRNEFRGAHYKPEFDLKQPKNFDPHEYIDYLERAHYEEVKESDFPPHHLDYMKRFQANNDKWLKTTIAQYKDNKPEITYEEVNTSQVTPRPRKYD